MEIQQSADSSQTTRPARGPAPSESVVAFLRAARDDFDLAKQGESENRERMMNDQKFRDGDMWPAEVKRERMADDLPCLTIDRISGPIDQVCGEERQARPAIQINPRGDGADRDTADALEGIIRAIQTESHAETAYDHAFESAVSIGLGAFRIYTEYDDSDPNYEFDQIIKIGWIENIFSVYSDPAAREPDRRDMRFCLITSWMGEPEFVKRYGKAAFTSLEEFASTGDGAPDWFDSAKGARIAEYWYRRAKTVRRARLDDGRVVDADTLDADQLKALGDESVRDVLRWEVRRAVISATHILEGDKGTDAAKNAEGAPWPGKYIPVVYVFGKVLNIDGKRRIKGIIRGAQDMQKQINVMESAATEVISLAARAGAWVAPVEAIEPYKEVWKTANRRNYSVLPYVSKDDDGREIQRPIRDITEPPIRSIVAMAQRADINFRGVTNFYDATDPARPNAEQSGRAILARTQQGATGNIGYIDNLKRAMAYAGEILVDLVPPVIGERPGRIVQILGEDQTSGLIKIGDPNAPTPAAPQAGVLARMAAGVRSLFGGAPGAPPPQPGAPGPMAGAPGAPGAPPPGMPLPGMPPGGAPPPAGMPGQPINTAPPPTPKTVILKPGRYGVVVTVGASYATKRQETVATLVELFKAFPPAAQVAMDVLVDNMDGPGMHEVAQRLKTLLPPNIQQAESGENAMPPHVQAAIAQRDQALQALQQQLSEVTGKLKNDAIKYEMQIHLKQMEIDFQNVKARRDSETKISVAELGAREERLQLFMDERARLGMQAHDAAMAAADASHDSLQAQADRSHDGAMAAMSAQAAPFAGAPPPDANAASAPPAAAAAPPDGASA